MAVKPNYRVATVEKKEKYSSSHDDLYRFEVDRTGETIEVEAGDSAWYIEDGVAKTVRGPAMVTTEAAVTVIRGYAPRNQIVSIEGGTNLPYINGCSSEQLIPPVRVGDPTMQLLYIPPNAMEQAHHIHATARVVHVLEGSGQSVIGMNGETKLGLSKGMTLVLDRMVPHHFVTGDDCLLVAPIHIWSSTPLEQGHPMFYGTIKT